MMHKRAGPIHPARSNYSSKLLLFGFLLLAGILFHSSDAVLAGDGESWCTASRQSAVPDAECRALEELYNSTQGDAWRDNSGWLNSTAVCRDWTGISCSDGHVSLSLIHI